MSSSKIYNTIIIGSGPSGYSAAVYNARAMLDPLLFAGEKANGQLMYTTDVENYAGFKDGIMGPKLMLEMREQALRFGTQIIDRNVTKIDVSSRPFTVWQQDTAYKAHSIIIATGAEAITLNLPKETQYMGRGVSTCAVCDAAFYRDKVVYVVGGGDSAMEDTLALAKFASKVYVVIRRDVLRASKIMQDRVLTHEKVALIKQSEVIGLGGKDKVEHLIIRNNKTNQEETVSADGLFYAIGHRPITEFLGESIFLDEKGYILTSINGLKKNIDMYTEWLSQYPTMTSVEGVFAAGDVVDFRYRQAITAAAFGCMAALDTEKWLEANNID